MGSSGSIVRRRRDRPRRAGGAASLCAAPLARAGDTLPNGSQVDILGYGVEDFVVGGDKPTPAATSGLRNIARADIIPGGTGSIRDEYMKLSANHSQDKGGSCLGDSGGPNLLAGTDTILAINSFVVQWLQGRDVLEPRGHRLRVGVHQRLPRRLYRRPADGIAFAVLTHDHPKLGRGPRIARRFGVADLGEEGGVDRGEVGRLSPA